MVEVIKIMVMKVNLLQKIWWRLCCTPRPRPCSRPPIPLLVTPGHSGQVSVSLLWGHCSFLLGPGAHKVLFVPAKSLFSQSYVSSGNAMVGLKVTSSRRAYATPRSAAPRAPAPVAGHC